ncbi:MAG TPA: acetoacetate decarboxylase family protein [Spirochaetota bacterium]|nr:acetoacetate decarboxylase family protein [Spirochaetota bacterium]
MNTVINKKEKSAFFRGVYQWQNKKYNVRLPIFYYDCSSMSAIYTASTKLVRPHLPDGLHPVEIFPGRCLVTLSAFEYRDSDIGAYNEFSVAALVRHGKKPLPLVPVISSMMKKSFEAFIIHLPVTSERARHGGVELGGYPKFLADIDFRKNQGLTECTLSLKKDRIVTMRGRNLKTGAYGKIKYTIYTRLGGCLVNSVMHINPHQFAQSLSGNTAAIEVGGGHAICGLLSGIKLGKKPLVYQSIPSFEAILCGTKNLLDR